MSLVLIGLLSVETCPMAEYGILFDVLWTNSIRLISMDFHKWGEINLQSVIKLQIFETNFQIFETRKLYYFSTRACIPNFYPENGTLVQAQNLKFSN